MKRKTNRILNIGILLLLCLFLSKEINIKAIEINNQDITMKYYIMLLEKMLEKKSSDPIETAIEIGLVKVGEFEDFVKPITNEHAAVLANRADFIKNGKNELVEKQSIRAMKNGRISDYIDISEENRTDVYQAFVKGIIIGESNGMYSQSRKLYPNKKLLRKDALAIVKRLQDTKKRKKMSPDGQLIRITNLPKNYKRFHYILQAFPNSFYEKKFEFQRGEYVIGFPQEFIDYAYPNRIKNMPYVNSDGKGTVEQNQEMLDGYLDEWCQQIQKNLYHRLNVNYKTIDNKWINNLRSTYVITGIPNYDKMETTSIKNYVNKVKKNKIAIETNKIIVEPSSLYYDSGYRVRCYVKFRLVNTSMKNNTSDDLLYCSFSNVTGFTKGKWLERYFDVTVTPASNNSYGEDYYVSGNDELLEWKDSVVK